MTSKMRSVSAIRNGTVIDHIPAGQGLQIMRILEVTNSDKQITIGLNLPSQRLSLKDLIKIENRQLSSEELNQTAVFAPQATINSIQQFKIQKKAQLTLPTYIKDLLACPNKNCITHEEPGITSHFNIVAIGKRVQLICYYCERQFDRDQKILYTY
jgi:aspartate carbamoyltransferase regulatory subunit